ncbi:hypothetical protein [Nocardia sp. NPDC049149]|uniref:hypothetical protein n=1 Tax=Nocardia sp. NPDC049149 TaxID=3364315 RepID=UPI0037242FFD
MSEVLLAIEGDIRVDPERLDRITDELADDLREINGLVITKPTSAVGDAKSTAAVEIGQLLASGGALGTAAWVIRDVIYKFLDRTRATSITVKNGDREVTIVRPADKQVEDVVERLRDVLNDD